MGGEEDRALSDGISALIKETAQSAPFPSAISGLRRRHLFMDQKLNLLVPWSWSRQPSELVKSDRCLRPPSQWYFCYGSWNEPSHFLQTKCSDNCFINMISFKVHKNPVR